MANTISNLSSHILNQLAPKVHSQKGSFKCEWDETCDNTSVCTSVTLWPDASNRDAYVILTWHGMKFHGEGEFWPSVVDTFMPIIDCLKKIHYEIEEFKFEVLPTL